MPLKSVVICHNSHNILLQVTTPRPKNIYLSSSRFLLSIRLKTMHFLISPTEKNNLNFSKLYCNKIIEQRLKHTNKKTKYQK